MLINRHNLDILYRGFSASFARGFEGAQSQYGQIAMTVPSSTRDQTYAWLGQIPKMREWLGERIIKSLEAHGFTITNRKFELTIGVERDDITDDQYGIFGPLFDEMGRSAREQPDELIFSLLKAGFDQKCFDGKFFFDTEHPVVEGEETVSVSNMQAGAGEAWYLLDTSRAIRPVIFQEREKPRLAKVDDDNESYVFTTDKFLYGVRARHNVGFGLWQLAFASKAELTPENYAAARLAMQTMKGDEGRLLGIRPNTLVVPPSLEGAARRIVSNSLNAEGGTNEWAGTATPIISPWLG
ncbi:Mu-like prophage major head subunit gpT family protein [Brevundimonas sp.]|uniref:Mu-like prophage major head subunit gpT family protein n=1 Tax=Brevundimonas sp. TaxID=1871086 RepID=UPI003D6C8FF7